MKCGLITSQQNCRASPPQGTLRVSHMESLRVNTQDAILDCAFFVIFFPLFFSPQNRKHVRRGAA